MAAYAAHCQPNAIALPVQFAFFCVSIITTALAKTNKKLRWVELSVDYVAVSKSHYEKLTD